MEVILYSTHCPKCNVLKSKLDEKGIAYTENTNTKEMVAKGFREAPVLEVDGTIYKFKEAVDWVGER